MGLFPREPSYPPFVHPLHRAELLASLKFPLVAENLHDNIMSLADQYAFGGTDHFDHEEVMKVPQILYVE